MSTELEKFIIAYSVETKGVADRVDKLHEKMSGAVSDTSKSKGQAVDFASRAAGELGKLVPGINAVSGAIKAMAMEAGIATAALALIAVGVEAASNLRDQYAQQRQDGMALGVSGTRLEEYQRKFVKHGNGYVDRAATLEGLKNFSATANAAYTDPSRTSPQARLMAMLGINVGARGAAPNGLNNELVQLATGLQGRSQGQVQGVAQVLGVSQDWLLTVQRLGPSIGKITELTSDEINERQATEKSLDKFNEEASKLKEKWNELNVAAAPLLEPLTKLVEFMEKFVDGMPRSGNQSAQNVQAAMDTLAPANPIFKLLSFFTSGWLGGKKGRGLIDIVTRKKGAYTPEPERKDERDKTVEKLDEVNKTGLKVAQANAAMLQQFASAVQSFSSAIDLSAAWAAWSGGALSMTDVLQGKSAGGSGASQDTGTASTGSRGISNNNPGNLEYGKFAIAAGATGSDGRFAIFPSMEAGMAAHERLLKESYIGKGLDTPRKIIAKYAPAIENNQGAYLSFMASRGFDPDARIKDVSAFAASQEVFETGYSRSAGTSPAAVAAVAQNTAQLKSTLNAATGATTVPQSQATFSRIAKQAQGLDAAREFVKGNKPEAKSPVTLENLDPVTIDISAHGKDAKTIAAELITRLKGQVQTATK
ncbi:hypothetical protein [Paraburkholderia aspalathi]|uniref:hypothetical protein n=1 Tax=Paraburkholderia aspalathi TaxID=1324617 RepID=UPI003C8FD8F7